MATAHTVPAKRSGGSTGSSRLGQKPPNMQIRQDIELLQNDCKSMIAILAPYPTFVGTERIQLLLDLTERALREVDPTKGVTTWIPPTYPEEENNPFTRRVEDLVRTRYTIIQTQLRLLLTYVAEVNAMPPPKVNIPGPSDYANERVWNVWQGQPTAILCGRPSTTIGFPVTFLHDAFRQFQIDMQTPLPPDDSTAEQALRMAHSLINEMPAAFTLETGRSAKFNELTAPFFAWIAEVGITSKLEAHGGRVDACIVKDQRWTVLREDKQNRDAFMQMARNYQIVVSRDLDTDAYSKGLATFLVLIEGPHIAVCGGCCVNGDVIVQYLSPKIPMIPSGQKTELDTVARALYALKRGTDSLILIDEKAKPVVPDQPRLLEFWSWPAAEGQGPGVKHPISFGPRLPGQNNDLFRASSSTVPGPLVVKFVNRPYGLAVHQHLAAHGLAPKLHGTIPFAQPSCAYVMECLDSEDDWMTLADLPQDDLRKNSDEIRQTIDQILAQLESGGYVHGDLRSNNIMVQLSRDNPLKLNVVDFDWAGEAGKAWYPYTRNETIIKWPGKAGSRIEQDHDRMLVDTWWEGLFKF